MRAKSVPSRAEDVAAYDRVFAAYWLGMVIRMENVEGLSLSHLPAQFQ